MLIKDKLIFITSVEPWGNIWYSKHHYANELSKNNIVYFLNAPPKWKFSNLFSFTIKITNIQENLFVVDYKNNLPIHYFIKHLLLANDFLNSLKLKRITGRYKKKDVLFWAFDPFRFIHFFSKAKTKKIFHVVDSYQHLYTNLQMARTSNLILVVSSDYIPHYKNANSNIMLIPHGISSNDLIANSDRVKEISKQFNAYFLLIGTFHSGINFSLLYKILESFPQFNLLLIGPVVKSDTVVESQWQKLKSKSNFFHIAEAAGTDLKNYVAAATLCLVADKYHENKKQFFRSSLKCFNYISQHKPIVSCLLHDLEPYNDKIIFMTNEEDNYIEYINLIVANKLPYDRLLSAQIIANSDYQKLIEKIGVHIL